MNDHVGCIRSRFGSRLVAQERSDLSVVACGFYGTHSGKIKNSGSEKIGEGVTPGGNHSDPGGLKVA